MKVRGNGRAPRRRCGAGRDSGWIASLDLSLPIIERLASRIVPLQAKLAAIQDCMSKLKQANLVEAEQRQLELDLAKALQP